MSLIRPHIYRRLRISTLIKMADSGAEDRKNYMPKFDPERDMRLLKEAEINYMRLIEQANLERVQKLQRLRGRNNRTGLLIGAGVLGIYFYSMYAVKQEKFLDFDEEITEKQ